MSSSEDEYFQSEEPAYGRDFVVPTKTAKVTKKKKKTKISTAEDETVEPSDTSTTEESSATTTAPTAGESNYLKPAHEIFSRIEWDEALPANEIVIGYLDRFDGVMEVDFTNFKHADIVFHRVRYYRHKEMMIWDRDKRIDKITNGEFLRHLTKQQQAAQKKQAMTSKAAASSQLDMSKLKPLEEDKENVVLFSYGSFCPIHNNHIRMMNLAIEQLRLLGTYNVVGAYFAITAQKGLNRKMKGKEAANIVSEEHRVNMVKLAVADHEYLSLASCGKNAGDAIKFVTGELHQHAGPVNVISVLGADSVKNLSFLKNKIVCVVNRKLDFDFDAYYEAHKQKDKFIIVKDSSNMNNDLSSTVVRTLIQSGKDASNLVSVKVLEYIQQKGLFNAAAGKTKVKESKTISSVDLGLLVNRIIDIPSDKVISWSRLQYKSTKEKDALGTGVSSTTYHMILDQTQEVAVKIISLTSENPEMALMSMQNEVNVYKCIQYPQPHIVQYYGSGIDMEQRIAFTVLEYINGGHLTDLVRETNLAFTNLEKLLKLLRHLALAMTYLHNITPAVLHRDIHGENLLLQILPNDEVVLKLTDFGLVQFEGDQDPLITFRGKTRNYPWEAVVSKKVGSYTKAADVFMFGMLIYECIECKEPYRGMTVTKANEVKLKGELPSISNTKKNKLCKGKLVELMNQCFEHNKEYRPTFAQIVEKLDSFLSTC